jgi:hypothetical protein
MFVTRKSPTICIAGLLPTPPMCHQELCAFFIAIRRVSPGKGCAIDALDPTESRDLYEILLERYRTSSMIVTSNRGPDEWLATFADPVRAQSAIDRFTSNAYDLVIEGESYRPRLKPSLPKQQERAR